MRDFVGAVVIVVAGLGCSSLPAVDPPHEDPRTSGAAHFQLAPLEHAVADARCGADVTLPSAVAVGAPLLEDDAQGADVTCRYDATHFEAMLYGEVGGLELRGTFDGAQSVDASVRIGPAGAHLPIDERLHRRLR